MIRILILSFFSSFLSAQQNELIQYPLNSNIKMLYAGDYKKGELDVEILNRDRSSNPLNSSNLLFKYLVYLYPKKFG